MDISVPDDNLMDVPSLLGNEKLKLSNLEKRRN